MLFLYIVLFGTLRKWFPIIYSYNCTTDPPRAPEVRKTWFGMLLTLDEVETSSTLDAAMLVEFCNLGMKIAAFIGVPLCVGLVPVYANFANDPRHARQRCQSGLEFVSMGAIPTGSWFYWVEAGLVWAVVVAVQYFVVGAQEAFLARRTRWLKAQPKPRATTLHVSNIPSEYRSHAKMQEYFERIFPAGAIESVYIAKHIDKLTQLASELENVKLLHHQALHEWKQSDNDPSQQPQIVVGFNKNATTVGAITFYQEVMDDLEEHIINERKKVLADDSTNGSEGFVTFRSRRDSEMTLHVRLENSTESFTMDYPPDPGDVRYSDLLQDPFTRKCMHVLGYILIAALFILFFPIISVLAYILNLENLQQIGFVKYIVEHMPVVQSLLEGVFATLAVSLFMGLLPTVLRAIISNCFTLRAEALSQYHLQQWYFWFQVVFVLLITSVGSSLLVRLQEIAKSPQEVFNILADTLPYTSRFYINYIVLQWATNLLNLTRYMNLLKFLGLRAIYDDDRAKELAEPEDEDYHGIGSRSARLTLILVIGLVFCTLCPVILIATFIFFFICRFVYTYLVVFAETKKVDLGGYFWCLQLRHVQLCMPIYILTMAGCLWVSAENDKPGIVAFCSLLYLGYSYLNHFSTLSWETLSFREVVEMERSKQPGPDRSLERTPSMYAFQREQGRYEQRALFPRDSESGGEEGKGEDASPAPRAGQRGCTFLDAEWGGQDASLRTHAG
jgi:hypothetical protein